MKEYTEKDAITEGIRLLKPRAQAFVDAREKIIADNRYQWMNESEAAHWRRVDEDILQWAKQRLEVIMDMEANL